MTFAAKLVPSDYVHPVYELMEGGGYGAGDMAQKGYSDAPEPGANVVTSKIRGSDKHTVMLDIDMEAALVPSTTPGHYHLYIDMPMPWKKYKRLLKELARAGVIEKGYAKASIRKQQSALRLRNHKKPTTARPGC